MPQRRLTIKYPRQWRYKHSAKGIAAQKEYAKSPAGKAANRRAGLKYNYGLTENEWTALFEKQGCVCAGCGATNPGHKYWHTHHIGSKKSGTLKVHGILCNQCNLAARQGTPNDIRRLRALADWLESLD